MELSSSLSLRAEGRAALSNVERAAAPPDGALAANQWPRPRAKACACERRALDSFRWALHAMANRSPTMEQVYSYLEDRKCPLYNTPRWKWPGGSHPLPDLETWKRYVRKARQAECQNPEP
jgi:hypothetical protein